VGVGQGGGLAADGLGDAAVAVAEAGDRGAARGVDDGAAVGETEADALTRDGGGWDGAGTVEDAGHGGGG
jgi:hypothetical protein